MGHTDPDIELEIPGHLEGCRIDKGLAELLPGYSRSSIQKWLKSGNVTDDGKSCKQSDKLRGNELLTVVIPATEPAKWVAQEMPLEVLYKDTDILVISKPAGMVVHPGAGNPDGTLLNGLLFLETSLRFLPRAGIVHRLDKDTTGLMVVALSERARQSLTSQLQQRTVNRQYVAIVHGAPITGETINQPIGRHRHDRLRMAITDRGKQAITEIRLRKKFDRHAVVDVSLQTGRTHQIRVHLRWRGYPIVGDPLYGGRPKLPTGASEALINSIRGFRRQALHAHTLSLQHPHSGEEMSWQQSMPKDMGQLIEALERG